MRHILFAPHVLILLGFSLLAAPVRAQITSDPCAQIPGQVQKNICYGKQSVQVEQDLAMTYQTTLKKLDPARQANLRQVERAWVAYRKLQCDQEGARFQGGSMQPTVLGLCTIQHAQARMKELHDTYDTY